jgi:hypothetical protein
MLASGPLPYLLGGSALLIVAAYLWMAGSAVVVDETHSVQTGVVTNTYGTEQQLYRLWGGYFYVIPSLEGTIEVRCSNGKRKRAGYVTGHMHTWVSVVENEPCQRVVGGV